MVFHVVVASKMVAFGEREKHWNVVVAAVA